MTNPLTRLSRAAALSLVVGTGVIVPALSLAPSALAADAAPQPPFNATPNKPDVKLRSYAGSVWYAVASVKPGTLLRVDAQDGEWYSVAYLPGMAAVVKANEADKKPDGTVVLNRQSKLACLDMNDPYMEACYRALFNDALPVGTSLKYVGDITGRSGKVEGYRVEAPAAARAWVSAGDVKKVTDAEAAKMGGSTPAVNQGKVPAPVQPSTPPATSGTPGAKPGAEPGKPSATPAPAPVTGAPAGGSAPASGGGSSGAAPGAAPTTTPAGTGAPAADGGVPPTVTTGEPQPGAATPTEPAKPREPSPEEIKAKQIAEKMAAQKHKLAQLDDAYRVVAAQPIDGAEIEPLIGEYQKYKDELGSDPANARTNVYVGNRIDLLKLRVELQEKSRKIAELRAQADKVMGNINSGIEKIQKSKEYLVVGRLVTSGMYDGQRLPLLYRVQSVDTNAGRTLAYLTPEQGQQLELKLGMIVGVKGEGPYDPSAKVNILVPKQVDVLKDSDGSPMQ